MKLNVIPLFFVLLLAGNISVAQNSVLAGKIVNENGKAIPGADIKIAADGGVLCQTRSDSDGLYCSTIVPCGRYAISVVLGGKDMGARTVKLDPEAGSKEFFMITVAGKKFSISKVDNDPALAVKLKQIEHEQRDIDYPMNGGTFILKRDTAGKMKYRPTYSSPEKAPQVK